MSKNNINKIDKMSLKDQDGIIFEQIDDFIYFFFKNIESLSSFYFRGESKLFNIPCENSLSRKFNDGYFFSVDEDYISSLEKYDLLSNASNFKEWVKIRHENNKVPFIDFSKSFFVALFFACNDSFDQDGYVYAISTSNAKPINNNWTNNEFINIYKKFTNTLQQA